MIAKSVFHVRFTADLTLCVLHTVVVCKAVKKHVKFVVKLISLTFLPFMPSLVNYLDTNSRPHVSPYNRGFPFATIIKPSRRFHRSSWLVFRPKT